MKMDHLSFTNQETPDRITSDIYRRLNREFNYLNDLWLK